MIQVESLPNGDKTVSLNFVYLIPDETIIEQLGEKQQYDIVSGKQILPSYLIKDLSEEETNNAISLTVSRLLDGVGHTMFERFLANQPPEETPMAEPSSTPMAEPSSAE